MAAGDTDLLGLPRNRPILGAGRGRMVVFAVASGALVPAIALHRFADAPIRAWAASHSVGDLEGWRWASAVGRPVVWLAVAVVGFGTASGLNWPNTARWTGMLALAVLWAGLADIAVSGEASGAATVGAAACTVGLWEPRALPLCGVLAAVVAAGQVVAQQVPASTALIGLLLGALGPVLLEFGWHAAAPGAVPVRGADWDA